jgi:putative DNA primase/helicase
MTEDHVRSNLRGAVPLASPRRRNNESAENSGAELELINGASIQPEAVHWCWPGYLARGKLHLLAGEPGTGKTTIAMSFAAAITSGSVWPSGDPTEAGDVLVWSGEDGTADTLLPRFLAAGGDASRIHFVASVQTGDSRRPFDPAFDMQRLSEAAKHLPGLKLVIIDPVSAAVAGDSHKNAETRRSLQPLVDLATERGCVVLGITHFAKGTAARDPLERVLGSIAFGAVARVVLATMRTGDAEGTRRFIRVKSNLGPDGGGFEYTVSSTRLSDTTIDAQRVEWGPPLCGTARDLMTTGPAGHRQSALSDAKAFLLDALQDGPRPINEIKQAATALDHSMSTLKRAEKVLGVKAYKLGKGAWYRRLPIDSTPEDDQHS